MPNSADCTSPHKSIIARSTVPTARAGAVMPLRYAIRVRVRVRVRVRIRKKLPEIAISLEKVEDKHRHRQVIPFLV